MGDVGTGFPRGQQQGKECSEGGCGEDPGGLAGTGPGARREQMIARQSKVLFGVKLAGVLGKGQTLQDVLG